MIYTGVDGEKLLSVDFSLFRKDWKITEKRGRKIYVIPSDLCYVRREKTELKDVYDLRRFLSIEVEEKFGDVLWDVRLKGDTYCLAVAKDFEVPEDAYALDPEVFSLARVVRALGREDCYVLDIGRRKTTLVDVEGGELYSYRVVLKGLDYIKREVPEEVVVREGLDNEGVRKSFERILSSLGRSLEEKPVLLSGGGSKLRGIDKLFKNSFRSPLVSPEMISALGASLKFVLEDCSPHFREEELSEKDIKKVSLALGASLLIFVASVAGINYAEKSFVKRVREVEKREFKRKFPQKPAVAVRDQVKSMFLREENPMTGRLLKLSEKLSEGMKLYRIEFEGGVLRVVGEAKSKDIVAEIGAKSVKETPEGGFEFEVEIR